jgi:RsiW-degrading membrane proteinase PrsW (M82 family)
MRVIRPTFLGIIAAIFTLILEIVFSFFQELDFNFLFETVSWASVLFIFIEEILKIFIIWKNYSDTKEKNSPQEILCESWLIGFGFSIVEIWLIFLSSLSPINFSDSFSLLGIALVHIGTSGFIGFLLIKKPSLKNFRTLALLLLIPIAFHFFYNFLIIYSFNFWPILLFLLLFFLSQLFIYKKL